MTKLEIIIPFVKEKHKNQKRKDGKPYFSHLEAVAKNLEDYEQYLKNKRLHHFYEDLIVAGYGHDLKEDQGVEDKDLIKNGFGILSTNLINTVSRKEGENYFDFIKRITLSPYSQLASLIKLADLKHNMSDLGEGSLKDKYRFAEHYILSHL